MNNKTRKVLEKVFKDPVSADIPWKDIEKLFLALGGEVKEGSGSRVRIKLGAALAVFHRPHPEKVTDKGAVKSVRKFLVNSGELQSLEDVDA
ncbi:type II toxin-antitoxin system HicA family toxin [Bdellovibrionales bacterium]|nr:type II toxin-antitoxin system HicA family toxin [Bdellovibrionales bacterium]